MAEYRGPVIDWTFDAGASSLASYQYCIVKLHTDGTVVLAETAGAAVHVLGVLQNKPGAGEQALVRIFGGSKLKVSGGTDIVPGDGIVATTGGVGVKNTNDKYLVVGRCFQAYGDSGTDIYEVFVNPGWQAV